MYDLNLPLADLKIRKQWNKEYVFDRLRKQYVRLTPEEWVRQHFVNYFIHYKHYPEGLLANEICIKFGKMNRRCDTILYDYLFQARMVVEYKSPVITLTQKCIEQIVRYNMSLKVSWLIVSNGLQHYCCNVDERGKYVFMKVIPEYHDL
ncbi:MAG: type I restriction enzyme HsdR N-terminal domain-containing protein [Candidatus Azobacteroides pseudotrichonymphae]|jgi:hypothetical protein|uniref:Type I restriction enzyme R protein N-terminal domain-containing protein n=1 Tax=Azobacteroides pseudotrichonymphae genomovar. CFP2 TaxID=511995 RepID=B6YQP1_AZOPC|nr:type I restriction enzyme HsdR N-terminal domain-containing protein [Candidatus Azobacteroides pseudotrichonymphae]BAG83513.1 conserved hypothetical protein [Candidatus Azobacteroides pseudotrichonymphae genomovar. CFP2]GMO32833.1 MAG: type I restriction enzyme HsdR N-terminal domain-containing protein [Candidatus Azobacteroides pseudotrichonymphae]